jgi:hypothetical protein
MHADDMMMTTSLDSASSAWNMVPENALDAIPKDVWEISAAGGFCLRNTTLLPDLELTSPPEDWMCVICLDEDANDVILIDCGHTFHSRCVRKWFRRSEGCPLCRRKCRHGPAVVQPEMDFELQSWPMLPASVIEQDTITQSQERVQAVRDRRGPFSIGAMNKRRRELAERFGCEVPAQAFFQEIDVNDDPIGPDVVLARSQKYREEVHFKQEQLQAAGFTLTVWPVEGRWRPPPHDASILARHSAMTARLAARHHSLSHLSLALQRRTTGCIAQYVLGQCYRKVAAIQEDNLSTNVLSAEQQLQSR